MTINSQANKTIVAGDGIQTQFGFSFVGVNAQYIAVILTDAGGNETILDRGNGVTQYQIALNAPVQGAIWGIGGTVTYNPSGVPIPNGSTLTILRILPLTQAISLQSQSSLETLGVGAETGLDTIEMQLQQISETISRAILMSVTNVVPPEDLPPAAQIAGKGAVFSPDGTSLIAGEMPANGFISSAMAPVVGAATLALARVAFGLGAMATEGIGGGLADDGAGNARVIFGINEVATNQAIVAASYLTKFIAGASINFTLARANTLWSGFGFWVDATGGDVTLVPDANDTINVQTATSGAPVRIPRGTSVFVKTNAANSGSWWIEWQSTSAQPTAPGGFSNLRISNDTFTNPDNRIRVTADEAVLLNSVGGAVQYTALNLSIDCTVTGANGFDVGTIPASGAVAVWLISNGTTVAGLASLSFTNPTLPPGYSFKKRIGAMMVPSASKFYRSLQLGRQARYTPVSATNTAVLPVMSSGNIGGSAFILLGPFVPPTASRIFMNVYGQFISGNSLSVSPNNAYTNPDLPFLVFPAAAITIASQIELLIETTSILINNNFAANQLNCYGWEDNI